MRDVLVLGPRGLRLHAQVPESRRERMRGLLGRIRLGRDEALLLERCRSIHTFGMRFVITVALLDRRYVLRRASSVRPGRIVLPRIGARHVLELAEVADVRPGDRLVVRRA